jgi:hypothetical protein
VKIFNDISVILWAVILNSGGIGSSRRKSQT